MMTTFRHRQLGRQAIALLERERLALLNADMKAIGQISDGLKKTADALQRLEPIDDLVFQEQLTRIRAAAEHNGKLADASRRGLRAASRIWAEMNGARANLHTYTGTGLRRDLAAPSTTRDRRT